MGEGPSAIVIGAGIVGVCCAIELVRRGVGTTLVDRLAPGEACSFGNAGILGSQSVVPFALPGILRDVPRMLLDPTGPLVLRREGFSRTLPWLARFLRSAYDGQSSARADAMKALNGTSHELHERLAREAGVPELVRPSHYLYLFRRPEDAGLDSGLAWRLRRERGARIDVFDGAAVRELEPAVSRDYRRAVRLGPIGHTVDPFRLTQAYAGLFQKEGGRLLRAHVRRLKPDGARTHVETDTETLAADFVVLAAGSWTMRLLEPLGIRFPLIAERGYHLTFADPGVRLENVLSDPSHHAAVSSMEPGLRIAGTEELGDPDAEPDWRRAEVLKRHVARMLPAANLSKPSRWMGPRPGTPDSLPVIGPVPGHPHLVVTTGHGHLGLTGAPMTGRIVAALAAGERLNIDLEPYRLQRFMRS